MNQKAPLFEATGVRGYAIGDDKGSLVAAHATGVDSEHVAAASVAMASVIASIGNLVGIGAIRSATARASSSSWVFAFRDGQTIAVELDSGVSTTDTEMRLQTDEWPATSPVPISDGDGDAASAKPSAPQKPAVRQVPRPASRSDTTASTRGNGGDPLAQSRSAAASPPRSNIDASRPPQLPGIVDQHSLSAVTTAPSRPNAPSAAGPAAAPGSAPARTIPIARVSLADTGESSAGRNADPRNPAAPQVPRPSAVKTQVRAPLRNASATSPNLVTASARGFRRAFVRGELNEAVTIAEQLKAASTPDADRCGSGASAPAIEPLTSGIASVLSGDLVSAVERLKPLVEDPDYGLTIQWLATTWLARAHTASIDGLDAALAWAEQAGRLSKQLDQECRAVSARVIAEVCLHRKNLDHALRFAEQARKLSESLADRDESSESFVLLAKIHYAKGDVAAAISSAEKANTLRQEWLPPVAFLCQRAFAEEKPDRVLSLIQPLLAQDEPTVDVLRLSRIHASVCDGRLPAKLAAEFLELLEQSPSSSVIERLQALTRAYPDCEFIADTLGWKLLKSGRTERGTAVFKELGQRADLPDEVKASVMLALGFLEARQGTHTSSGAKIRATVDAAPKHLQVNKSPSHSSGRMRAARPVDLADIEPLSSTVQPSATTRPPQASGRPSPTFTGDLKDFSLPDVLAFLHTGRSSGTLLCSSVRGVGAVHLANGLITGAAAPGTMTLRNLLVSRASLTEAMADKALELQKSQQPIVPIGVILVKNGWCARQNVIACLREQIASALGELLKWGDGQFAFDPEVTLAFQDEIEVAVNPQSLLSDFLQHASETAKTQD